MRGGIAVGLVVAVWPLVAQAVVLERVRVQSGRDVSVELSVSSPVVPWVRRLAATGDLPHRIYIDLPDTVVGANVRKLVTTSDGPLARVRTGQFTPTTARIVLDTSG